jgi:Neisseria meningitidis TspB protein
MRSQKNGFFIRHLLRFVCASLLGCIPLTSAFAYSWDSNTAKKLADGTIVLQPTFNSMVRDVPGHIPTIDKSNLLLTKAGDVLIGPSSVPVSVTHTGAIPKAKIGAAIGKKLLTAVPLVGSIVSLSSLMGEFAAMAPGHVTVENGELKILREINVGGCTSIQGYVIALGASCTAQGVGYCSAGLYTDPVTSLQYNQCGSKTVGSEYRKDPYSATQLANDIASSSGWPTDPAGAEAIKNRVSELVDEGHLPQTDMTRKVTGPASIPAPPTTTTITNPDGSTSTKTVNNETRITYEGDRISTETVTTTTTINNTTNITEEQKVESTPNTDPTKECDGSIGCLKPGQAPEEVRDPAQPKAFEYIPVTFASSASCPAPINFDVFGHQYMVAWTPFCDMAAAIRGVVLVLGGMMAAFVLADSFRVF